MFVLLLIVSCFTNTGKLVNYILDNFYHAKIHSTFSTLPSAFFNISLKEIFILTRPQRDVFLYLKF